MGWDWRGDGDGRFFGGGAFFFFLFPLQKISSKQAQNGCTMQSGGYSHARVEIRPISAPPWYLIAIGPITIYGELQKNRYLLLFYHHHTSFCSTSFEKSNVRSSLCPPRRSHRSRPHSLASQEAAPPGPWPAPCASERSPPDAGRPAGDGQAKECHPRRDGKRQGTISLEESLL